MRRNNQVNRFLSYTLMFSAFFTVLVGCSSSSQNGLEGAWTLDWLSSSSTNLAGDLTFGDGKSLRLNEVLTGNEQVLRYAVIAPGKMKITIEETPLVVEFSINEDVLTIKFDDGRNSYHRVEQVQIPEDNDLATWSEYKDDETEVDMKATQPNMNQIFPSTSTPRPTGTSAPVVAQQATATKLPNTTPTPKVYSPLSRCAESRLQVGDSAYVNYETGRLSMRSEPVGTIGDTLVRRLEEGEILHITDGPKCDMGWIFWKVRTVYSETGWIPEGDGNEFWVVPISTNDVCSGAKPTRLMVGDRAFVEPEPEDYNRIYPEPAIDSEKLLYRMKPGSYMEVLEGPSCGSGRTGVWWYVRSEDSGIEGWTRESDYSKSYYFIAPVIPSP